VLSLVELAVLLVLLYHPHMFELQEQRMLAMEPMPHPLHGHPVAAGLMLLPLAGTIAVAERLGYLHLHPHTYAEDREGRRIPVPIPWIGDFLAFLHDDKGPYCVNLTVKAETTGFSSPFRSARPTRNPDKARLHTMARHAIEEVYYADAGIATVRVVDADIPRSLANNLREVYLWYAREVQVDEDLRQLVIDRVRGCLLTAQAPLATLIALQLKTGLSLDTLKTVMYQAVWNRELKVDLFGGPIFPDQIWRPQTHDVLVHFQHWFAREAS
jgi:hypothetical protein